MTAAAELDPNTIAIAFFGCMGLIVPAAIAGFVKLRSISRENRDHLEALRADMHTNHGKTPGEHLEMIGQVALDVALLDRKLDAHTAQDAENFAALRDAIDAR